MGHGGSGGMPVSSLQAALAVDSLFHSATLLPDRSSLLSIPISRSVPLPSYFSCSPPPFKVVRDLGTHFSFPLLLLPPFPTTQLGKISGKGEGEKNQFPPPFLPKPLSFFPTLPPRSSYPKSGVNTEK